MLYTHSSTLCHETNNREVASESPTRERLNFGKSRVWFRRNSGLPLRASRSRFSSPDLVYPLSMANANLYRMAPLGDKKYLSLSFTTLRPC